MDKEKLANKKILYLVKTLSVGGAERFTFNLSKYFVNVFSEVAVFSSGGIFTNEMKNAGIKIYNSPLASGNGVINYFLLKQKLAEIISSRNFDIIHCQHRYFVPIIRSLQLKNIKTVYTANNYFNDFYQWFIDADALVGISFAIYQNLLDTRKHLQDKISLINYGVEENKNQSNRNDFSIGFSGRIIKEKGIFELLDAMQILRDKFPSMKLIIRGSEKVSGEVQKYIIKKELSDNVEIKKTTINLSEIYNGINIMVLPSKLNEGLPLSLLECLINRILVVTTQQGAINDLIIDGKTGFILNSATAQSIAMKLEYIFNNLNKLEEIRNSGYEIVKERYSLTDMLYAYHKLYNNLIS